MKLETEHGTYEAESEAALLKLARAGKRKHAVLMKVRESRRAQANLIAESLAYRILARFVRGEEPCQGWEYMDRGAQYSPAVERDEYGSGETIILDRPDGQLPWKMYGYSLFGSVSGAAGTLVVFMRDNDAPHAVFAHAVGSHAGELGFEPLPECITPDWFGEAKAARRERMEACRAQQEEASA